MQRLCIFGCMMMLGWAGWWIGSGGGLMTAFLLSGAGSFLGVYVGWRLHRDYLG